MSDNEDPKFAVGGDFSVHGSNFAGRDQHFGDKVGGDKVGRDKITNQSRTNVRLGLGVLVLALVGGGGYVVSQQLFSSPTDVVFEEGLEGALKTVGAIKQAEVGSNAADWCTLTSADSGDTCRAIVASAFTSRPELRAELKDVVVGAVTGSDTSAQVSLSFRGSGGPVQMRWNGERWEVDRAAYLFSINNGGLAMTAVLNAHQCGVILGVDTGCKK